MDDLSDLGVLIRAAHGLDRAWWDAAKCRQWEPPDDAGPLLGPWRDRRYRGPSIWQVEWDQEISWEGHETIRGQHLIALAVLICEGCPAQWDCATYAVRGLMQGGTWATTPRNVRWLVDEADAPLDLIEAARSEGVPVNVAVRSARFGADVSSAA